MINKKIIYYKIIKKNKNKILFKIYINNTSKKNHFTSFAFNGKNLQILI